MPKRQYLKNNDKKNICLVGFMGSGKTTVGKLLSKSLKFEFVDTDEKIEKENFMKIKDIFEDFGESFFRDLETKKIIELAKNKNQILSIGGGAFCFERNIKVLKENCLVFYINIPFDEIVSRLSKRQLNKRPLFHDLEKAEELFNKRQFYYQQADFILNASAKTSREIKKEIKNILIKL
ncbi:MAG: shikimate kinase [Candidatus Sericytochromatia bacterium]